MCSEAKSGEMGAKWYQEKWLNYIDTRIKELKGDET